MTRAFAGCLRALAAVPCIAFHAQAQSVFLGSVVADLDPSPPLANAEIIIAAINRVAHTDSLGRFVFNDLPKGTFGITVRRVGYEAINVNARFSGTDTVAADFALTTSAVALDTVQVEGAKRVHGKFLGFEERRAHGGGLFLSRADLEKNKDRPLGEILARLPGVRINRYGAESAVASARFGGGRGRGGDMMDRLKGAPRGCYAQIYLDNVRVFSSSAGEALFNINSIQPSVIQGIEYYPSRAETPIEFATPRADCGTMVIWTRIE